jgi:hypothetical protein
MASRLEAQPGKQDWMAEACDTATALSHPEGNSSTPRPSTLLQGLLRLGRELNRHPLSSSPPPSCLEELGITQVPTSCRVGVHKEGAHLDYELRLGLHSRRSRNPPICTPSRVWHRRLRPASTSAPWNDGKRCEAAS